MGSASGWAGKRCAGRLTTDASGAHHRGRIGRNISNSRQAEGTLPRLLQARRTCPLSGKGHEALQVGALTTEGTIRSLQAVAGNRSVAALIAQRCAAPDPAPPLQRQFANAAAVPAAVAGWTAGTPTSIKAQDGGVYRHPVGAQDLTTVFYQDAGKTRSYLIPVLVGVEEAVPPSAFFALFEGGQFRHYLAIDATERAFAFNHEASTEGGTMDALTRDLGPVVETLIDMFDVTSVSRREAESTKDYIVTYQKRTNRIDRQGPAFNRTHARFAVQIGSGTYAGIHMPVGYDFPIDLVRNAFRASFGGRYRKLTAT